MLADGKEKVSKITAKTEEAARTRVAKLNKVKEWIWIKEETAPVPSVAAAKSTPTVKLPPVAKPISAKTSTRLDNLLYLQSSKCFFCGRVLTKAEASVEHLLPKSKGGTEADGNVVACCGTLNRVFGSMELKEKVRFVLEQGGKFTCPK